MHDGTGIHFGMKYALALLDPQTRDEVSYLISAGLVDERFEGRPIAWDDPETAKYIVLMTDGQITDQFRPTDPTDPLNGHVELQHQDSANRTTFSNKSSNIGYLQQQCALARDRGVTIFTIAFETNDAAAQDMLDCASSPSHHFRVEGNDIALAFDSVARQINSLRLIQ
jgi:hypothetical protein